MAQVGEAKAVLRPLLAQQGAGEDAAEAFQQALGLLQGGGILGAAAGNAEGQHALAGRGAAQGEVLLQQGDLPWMTGQGQLGLGFDGVGQAQHGQRHARLGQAADALESLFPVGHEDRVEILLLGQPADPHAHLGDDAETPFRAQHQLAQVRTRRRGWESRQLHRAGESFQGAAGEQLLDAAIAQRLLAAGAAGHPAAEGGQLPGLREVAQGVAAGAQLALHLRAAGAGAEGGDEAFFIQFEEAAHALQGEGQHWFVAGLGIDMPSHRRAAAVGDQYQAALSGQGQQLTDLLRGFREGDAVGELAELAFAHRQPVRQALATGVTHAGLGIQADQRMGFQARGRHPRQHLLQAGIDQGLAGAYTFGQECRSMGGQLHHRCLIPPAVPASHAVLLVRVVSKAFDGCLY
ncbi:hypothetical protein D3C85_834670 [compost metagenome]